MQQQLQSVAELFEVAADGADGEVWVQRFEKFLEQSMAEHKRRLKTDGSAAEKQAEIFRARFSLFGIVEERIDAHKGAENGELVAMTSRLEALKALQVAQAQMFQELLGYVLEAIDTAKSGVCAMCGNSKTVESSKPHENKLEGAKDAVQEAAAPANAGGSAAFVAARQEAVQEAAAPAKAGGSAAFVAARRNRERVDSAKESKRDRNVELDLGAESQLDAASGSATPVCAVHYEEGEAEDFFPETSPSPRSEFSWSPRPDSYGPGRQDDVDPVAVFRQIRKSNSYALRHREIRSFGYTGACRSTFAAQQGLSLEQLMEVMQTVYASKAEHNEHCNETGELTQTMEQHFYMFLRKRYVDKKAVQEWCTAVFGSIQKYAQIDCSVTVFGKILQNRLAESFPAVLDTLRQTVNQLLRDRMQKSHGGSPAEQAALWQAYVTGRVCTVSLEECSEILPCLYSSADTQEVMNIIQQVYSNPRYSLSPGNEAPADSIHLKDLHQVLFTFQMNLTEAFLADFIKEFNEVDNGPSGVLNTAQLQDLTQRLCNTPSQDQKERGYVLNEAREKLNSQIRHLPRATFSECVTMFGGLINARWAVQGGEHEYEDEKEASEDSDD